jgi:hypothetical protein
MGYPVGGIDPEWCPEEDYWRAEVTGMTGQQNNLRWLQDGDLYSFTGVTREILNQLVGRDKEKPLNGYRYWTHPYFENRTLLDLKEAEVRGEDRISNGSITE